MKQAQRDFITVGLVAIAGATDALPRLMPRLSAEDRVRAERFRLTEDRVRFVLGRALLGRLLADELDYRPAQLQLALTEHGRPVLPSHPEIHFSISHAGEWVGVALARGAEVGFDIESLDRNVDFDALAPRIFNNVDLARYHALPRHDQTRAFFQAWTGKEAVLKAKGLGLFGGVQNISVPLDDVPGVWTTSTQAGSSWHLQPVSVAEGYLASLACNCLRIVPSLRRFALSDLS